jgi:hypothetical protein
VPLLPVDHVVAQPSVLVLSLDIGVGFLQAFVAVFPRQMVAVDLIAVV